MNALAAGSTVLYDERGAVALVTLNRPDALNSFTRQMNRELWAALDRAVQPDGRLGWVQQVGYAPDQVLASATQLYGVGAYLMAASEVSRRPNW